MKQPFLLAALTLPALAPAQSNTIPGTDCRLTNSTSPTLFGRRGSAYPNGEVGISYTYTMCNPGTVPIPWQAPMLPTHPMFAFMVVRESNGRLEQITDQSTTYVKHAFAAANSASTCGGTCQTSGTGLRVNCTDTYGASTNANRFYLGPASEIDPWTGIWNPIGSYFDRGDPAVAPPLHADGVRSLTSGNFADPVKNRVTLQEKDLTVPGRLFYCLHIVVRGEDGDLHLDNLGHREMSATWNGTTWAFANTATPFRNGSVLDEWTGAQITWARNGEDDGHFLVAVKTSDNGNGTWHYEYAVHNLDNARGGASLRIPVCPSTAVTGVGFRDTNQNALDQWSWSRAGDELQFAATGTNSLDWNTIYNFWFDCDVGPTSGAVAIDQARLGAGALAVSVPTKIPGGVAAVVPLGAGCGAPAPTLTTLNGAEPLLPSPGFGLAMAATPGGLLLVAASLETTATVLAPGCTQWIGGPTLTTHAAVVADGAGIATTPFPLPSDLALDGVTVRWQAAELVASGPVFGSFQLTNAIATRFGCR
jgi:hypothetical protein